MHTVHIFLVVTGRYQVSQLPVMYGGRAVMELAPFYKLRCHVPGQCAVSLLIVPELNFSLKHEGTARCSISLCVERVSAVSLAALLKNRCKKDVDNN